jgi:hypothetical protein
MRALTLGCDKNGESSKIGRKELVIMGRTGTQPLQIQRLEQVRKRKRASLETRTSGKGKEIAKNEDVSRPPIYRKRQETEDREQAVENKGDRIRYSKIQSQAIALGGQVTALDPAAARELASTDYRRPWELWKRKMTMK